MRSPAEPRWLESQPESLHQTQCDSPNRLTDPFPIVNPSFGRSGWRWVEALELHRLTVQEMADALAAKKGQRSVDKSIAEARSLWTGHGG